jgi:multidrug efflux pump subunit AcrA (membrane-fusion protein)
MKRLRELLIFFILPVFLINCAQGTDDQAGSGVEPVPPKVKVVRVADRTGVQNKINVSGRIEPNVEALLSSEMDAKVTAVHVGLNENVKKGELLVELKSGPAGKGVLEYVISPIDGRVVELFMEQGEWIKQGDELLRVKNMRSVRVVLLLSAMHYEDMRIGQGVRMSVPGLPGLRFIGSIYSIAREIDEDSATFEVQVMVRNPQGKLKAGLKANASIDTGITKDVHVIPSAALAALDGKDIVYVVVDDHAVEREVVTVRKTGEIIQVIEGLTTGDLVVVDHDTPLTAGAKVIIID